jgi:hypothetical protein
MTTRRDLIVGGFVTALYASTVAAADALTPEAAGASVTSANAIQGTSTVMLISHSHRSFRPLLDQYFPKLSAKRHFAKISRNAALIVNNDSRPIYGYRVKWTSVKGGNTSGQYRRRFVNRPTKRLVTRQMTAQVPLLAPGDVALTTPFFTWSSGYFKAQASRGRFSAKRLRRYQRTFPLADGFMTRARRADSTTPSVDAVAFSNAVIGPKHQSFAKLMRITRAAEHDQALAILGNIQTNGVKPDAAFQDIPSPGAAGSNTLKAAPSYNRARKRFALRMWRLLRLDPARAQSVLLQVKAAPPSVRL